MFRQLPIALALCLVCAFASGAQADPLYFSIGNCVDGDCSAFNDSGRGDILAKLDVVNGNDLLITLTNRLNADAPDDDPYLTNLGFEYGSLLSGLSFDSFSVVSGIVGTPSFTVDSSIRSFFIDFGFGFSTSGRYSEREQRFQAMDPNEVVQILIGTTGDVDLSHFDLGVAKVAGAGEGGLSSAIVLTGTPSASVPEPSSLLLMALGFGAVTARRRLRASR
jgi:hypothetical protein